MYIRKISIGSDYKNAMHYIVGQSVINGMYDIDTIMVSGDRYEVWISSSDGVVLWKSFNASMPVTVEYNINF